MSVAEEAKKPKKAKRSKDLYPEVEPAYKYRSISLLDAAIKACRGCTLHATCTQHVPGTGAKRTDILLVGEGPGEQEDQAGVPFVGRAGDQLNAFLQEAGINRKSIRIANVVRCRAWDPVQRKNRPPTEDEALACRRWLWEEIRMCRAKVIVALGSQALRILCGTRKAQVSTAIGRCFEGPHGTVVVPCWHPAYYLRNRTVLCKQDILTAFAKAQRIVEEQKKGS